MTKLIGSMIRFNKYDGQKLNNILLNMPSATIPNEPNGVLRCSASLNTGFQKSQLSELD